MTRSKGTVSKEAMEIVSGKSMKKAKGRKYLTKKGQKTKTRKKISAFKKKFKGQPGHWKAKDPMRNYRKTVSMIRKSCKSLS